MYCHFPERREENENDTMTRQCFVSHCTLLTLGLAFWMFSQLRKASAYTDLFVFSHLCHQREPALWVYSAPVEKRKQVLA